MGTCTCKEANRTLASCMETKWALTYNQKKVKTLQPQLKFCKVACVCQKAETLIRKAGTGKPLSKHEVDCSLHPFLGLVQKQHYLSCVTSNFQYAYIMLLIVYDYDVINEWIYRCIFVYLACIVNARFKSRITIFKGIPNW